MIEQYTWKAGPGQLCLLGGTRVTVRDGDELFGFLCPDGAVVLIDFASRAGEQQ